MRPVDLNFQQKHWFDYRQGMFVLLASVSVAAIVAVMHILTIAEIRNQETIWRDSRGQMGQAGKVASNEKVDRLKPELKRANEIVQQLAMPWDQLFDAIEVFDPDQVALLRIETDMSRRTLTITAVSKNFGGMLGYMKNLNKQSALSSVYLVEHKVMEEDELKPVRFSILCSWNVKGS